MGGLIEPLGQARSMIEAIHRSIFPLALQWGLTTESDSAAWLAELGAAPASVSVRFPMMIGAFRRKTG